MPGEPPQIKHCWVTGYGGRQPGLLPGWRRTPAGNWEGRVVRPVPQGDRWAVAEDWVPAELLEPA
jgi:hypothetical protein